MLHTARGPTYGSANFGGYSRPELDEAIERAGRTLEPGVRLNALHQAMRLSLEDLPLIPLYRRNRTYGVDDGIRFLPRQNGQVVLFELAWAGAER
jgi:ABC-type oligopeptide transport system substrate-binding subunit